MDFQILRSAISRRSSENIFEVLVVFSRKTPDDGLVFTNSCMGECAREHQEGVTTNDLHGRAQAAA